MSYIFKAAIMVLFIGIMIFILFAPVFVLTLIFGVSSQMIIVGLIVGLILMIAFINYFLDNFDHLM